MGLSEEPDGYRVPQAEPVTAGFRRADLPVPPLLQQALDRVVEFDGFGVHPFVPDALDSSRPVAFENPGVSNVRPDGRALRGGRHSGVWNRRHTPNGDAPPVSE